MFLFAPRSLFIAYIQIQTAYGRSEILWHLTLSTSHQWMVEWNGSFAFSGNDLSQRWCVNEWGEIFRLFYTEFLGWIVNTQLVLIRNNNRRKKFVIHSINAYSEVRIWRHKTSQGKKQWSAIVTRVARENIVSSFFSASATSHNF